MTDHDTNDPADRMGQLKSQIAVLQAEYDGLRQQAIDAEEIWIGKHWTVPMPPWGIVSYDDVPWRRWKASSDGKYWRIWSSKPSIRIFVTVRPIKGTGCQ